MTERPETCAGVEDVDLGGRTVLVTGSTDGIGREAALALGRLGATVLVHGRDEEKGRRVVEAIEDAGADARLFLADFASLEAVSDLADSVAEFGPLDVLLNNAGGYFHRGRLTEDGFEYTFGVNHLAPFLLTNELRPHLADGARAVTTASRAHEGADGLDLDAVRSVEDHSGMAAYARSKLANILFADELARRLDGATSNSYHPGFIPGSALYRESPLPIRAIIRLLGALSRPIAGRFTATVEDGAATAVYLSAAPEVTETTGRYFSEFSPTTPAAPGRDRELAEALWERSEAWTAEFRG